MNIFVSILGVSLILIGILHALPPRARARLWAATRATLTRLAMIVCLVSGSSLLAYDWLWQVTATAPRPGALWRASLLTYDVGLDVSPPTTRDAGAVELWIYPYTADDIWPLVRVYGAPALPRPQPTAPIVAPPHAPLPAPTKTMKQV